MLNAAQEKFAKREELLVTVVLTQN